MAAVPQTGQMEEVRDGQELQLSDPATMDIVIHILLAVSPQSAGSQHWVIMTILKYQDYDTSLIVVE